MLLQPPTLDTMSCVSNAPNNVLSGFRALLLFFVQHGENISCTGIFAGLKKQRRELPSVVSLMIEDLCGHPPHWNFDRRAAPDKPEHSSEGLDGYRRSPSINRSVSDISLATQHLKVRRDFLIKGFYVVPNEPWRRHSTSDPTKPNAITDHDVIHHVMNGAKEGASITTPLLVAEQSSGIIHFAIHPTIVTTKSAT
jgi:hypothetical protein